MAANQQVLAAKGFSPLSIPALKLWLKADAGTFQTVSGSAAAADGDPVGEWQDQSGNGKHMVQATSTKRGTLKTGGNGQNGRAVVRGDGVDDILASAMVASAAADNFTVFVVAKSTANANFRCYISNGTPADGHQYFINVHVRTLQPIGMVDGGPHHVNGVCDLTTYTRQSGTMSLRVNGSSHTLTNNTTAASAATTTTTILARNDGYNLLGDLAEIIIYDGALTAPQILDVETYLNSAARWAVF